MTPEIYESRLSWPARLLIGSGIALMAFAAFSGNARAGQRSKGAVYLSHPAGCPQTAFCGCGAAWDLGIRDRALWLSTAWFKFPRSQPAPNRVAVRRGHVFVLKQHVSGKTWMVADYNSGGHRSRYHARSIAGYTIVNPQSRMAMVQQ